MRIPFRQYYSLLVSYLQPQRARVVWLAVLLFGSIGLELLNPQILRSFIDTATSGGATESLLIAAVLFIVVALAQQALAVATTYVSENVGWTATNALRVNLARHCLGLDQSFHKARTPGELIERIDGDVTALANFFSRFVVQLLGNALLLIGVLVLLFLEDWRVGAGLTLFALLALVIMVRLRSIAVPFWITVRAQAAQYFGFLSEQIAGTEDIRSSGATAFVMRRFYELSRNWLPSEVRAGLIGYSMWTTSLALFTIGNALAFALSAYLWSKGTVTIGAVYLIFTYTELLRRPIEQIRTQMEDLQKASASIVRINDLLHTRSQIVDGSGIPFPTGPLAVEFRAVSFEYQDSQQSAVGSRQDASEGRRQKPEGSSQEADETQHSTFNAQHSLSDNSTLNTQHSKLVLRDISLHLEPGKVLGLLGRTGSGKTTLARLLLRLYDPTSGEIRLGDVPLRDAALRDLRGCVGMVTQDVQLFGASVRDNVTFFNHQIDDARIEAVLDELGLGPWLRALPAGLDTLLRAGSGGLSAGEAQLLAFARVFLQDPGLVILDEASSRLDPATEALIERAIDRLLQGRTGIIIAHRLGTVRRADQIVILENGEVLEHGDRISLAGATNTRFAHLLRTGMEEVLA